MEDEGGVPVIVALTAILVVAKLTGFVDIPWIGALAPIWIPVAVVVIGYLLIGLGKLLQRAGRGSS